MGETTDLSDLIARVEGASGQLPDDLLGRVICAAHGVEFDSITIGRGDDGTDEFTVWAANDRHIWSEYRSGAPDVSLDGAIVLMARVRPGWVVRLDIYGTHASAGIEPPWTGEMLQSHSADAATPALAICLALLKSLSLEPSQ